MSARYPVSAAILCGGEGRRMGGADKGALVVSGTTILDRQLGVLRPLTPHIMLIDRHDGRSCPPGARIVRDAVEHAGALGGIYTALLAAATDRVLVLACDMPFITAAFLDYLLQLDEDADVVIPRDLEGRHPLCGVFHRRIAPTIEAHIEAGRLRVDDALGALDIREVGPLAIAPFDRDGRLLLNVNTPHDYQNAVGGDPQGATCR